MLARFLPKLPTSMQEQLPLRPAEFVKIRDGFIAFLKQPAGTPIEHVVPQHIIDAMTSAAKRGRKRRRVLDVTKSASVFVAVAGAIVGLAINPMIVGTVIMLAGGMAFVWALNQSKVRAELEIDELVNEPNEMLHRNLNALDAFKGRIACGDIPCEERLPDGAIKPLTANMRQAFLADHGALLILSRDQDLWECIPKRPVPKSALWVRLDGRIAPVFVTSRSLLDTADGELFDRRIAWLLSHADQHGSRARSFREAVQAVVALRRPEFEGLTFEQKKQRLSENKEFSASRLEKLHAGIYPPFDNFLRTLPMHEFP
jgi:hypothetical protein